MKTTGQTATPTTENASETFREKWARTMHIAGPDDPIYSSGLTVTSLHGLRPSTPNSPANTAGAPPQEQISSVAQEKSHPLDGEDISVRPSLIANGVPRDKWPQGQISLEQAAKLIAQYGSRDNT